MMKTGFRLSDKSCPFISNWLIELMTFLPDMLPDRSHQLGERSTVKEKSDLYIVYLYQVHAINYK